MDKEKLTGLIGNYRRDLADYQQLYEEMVYFQQHLPANLIKEGENPESENSVESGQENEYVQTIDGYMEKRDRQFAVIMARAQVNSQIIQELAENLGLDQFNLTNLKQVGIDPDLIFKLEQVLETLTGAMEKVIGLDQEIADKLKMDYEATKLQVQRLSSSRRVKNAYRNDPQTEAFFIDKNK